MTLATQQQAARPSLRTDERPQKVKTTPTEQLVLFAIGEKERYGLAIQSAIKECSNGETTISTGSLYPTLQKLEEKELILSRSGSEVSSQRCDRKRRYYRLSDAGKSVLADVLAFQEKLLSWDS
ncbi:MAG: PadR family transcriptional regulator [Cyanobacteria bacterium P01_F01_bin.3]